MITYDKQSKLKQWQQKITKIQQVHKKRLTYQERFSDKYSEQKEFLTINLEQKKQFDAEKAFKKKLDVEPIQILSNQAVSSRKDIFLKQWTIKQERLQNKDSNPEKTIHKTFVNPKRKRALRYLLEQIVKKKNMDKLIQKAIRYPNDNERVKLKIKYQSVLQLELLILQHLPISIPKLITHNWQNIISLNLKGSRINDRKLKILMLNIYQFPDLESLNLGENHITQNGTNLMAQYLNRCMHLKKLHLDNNRINARAITKLLRQKGTFSFLCDIQLGENFMGDQGFSEFCRLSSSLPFLKKIGFNSNNLRTKSMAEFNRFSDNFISLKILELIRNKINDDGAEILSQNFHRFSSLKFIYLDSNHIRRGFKKLVSKMRKLELEKISINQNNICSIDEEEISIFDNMSHLREVSLLTNPLIYNQACIKRLIKKYQLQNQNIQYKLTINFPNEVNLSGLPISIQRLTEISQIFGLSHVTEIDFSQCNFTDADWNEFVEKIDKFYQIFSIKLDNNRIQTITHNQIQNLVQFVEFKNLKKRQTNNYKKKMQKKLSQKVHEHMAFTGYFAEKIKSKTSNQSQETQDTTKDEPFKKKKIKKYKDQNHFIEISLLRNNLSPATIDLIESLETKIPIKFILETCKQQKLRKFRWDDFKSKKVNKAIEFLPTKKQQKSLDNDQSFFHIYGVLAEIKANILQENIDKEKVQQMLDQIINFRIKTDEFFSTVSQDEPNLLESFRNKILSIVDIWVTERQKSGLEVLDQKSVQELINLREKMKDKILSQGKTLKGKYVEEIERIKQEKKYIESQLKNFSQFVDLISIIDK